MFGFLRQYQDQVYDALRSISEAAIAEATSALVEVHRRRGTIFVLCPPEDSSSVEHFVRELSQGMNPGLGGAQVAGGSARSPAAGFRLVQVLGSPRQIVAWQNDWAYEDIYAEQIRGRIRRGDVVLAISRRGDTANVVNALQAARALGAVTISLVGGKGSGIREASDITLHAGTEQPEQVEAIQTIVEHMLCVALQRALAEPAEVRPAV